MPAPAPEVFGAGLGLRQELVEPLLAQAPAQIQFLEIAPENWMGMGGKFRKQLRAARERWPIVCHGLSLSLGGPAPLDMDFLSDIKAFLDDYEVPIYSEHLSYCSDEGHLYDLLPIPFTDEAIKHAAARIRKTQDRLERRIAVENVSYYAAPGKAMEEIDFLKAVLEEADCDLLLDVNNIYVNSVNHGGDPLAFLHALPADRVRYLHVAGHLRQAPDLAIDTHGADVIDPVWQLLAAAYARFGLRPTLLERDFNLPPLAALLAEIKQIQRLQQAHEQRLQTHA